MGVCVFGRVGPMGNQKTSLKDDCFNTFRFILAQKGENGVPENQHKYDTLPTRKRTERTSENPSIFEIRVDFLKKLRVQRRYVYCTIIKNVDKHAR